MAVSIRRCRSARARVARHRSLLLAAAGALGVACTAGTSQQALLPGAIACSDIVWAAPETLRTAAGHSVFVEAPQVVVTRTDTLLIGSWGMEVDSLPRILTAGFLLESNGIVRSIPLPIVAERWGPPRMAAEPDGRVAVFWVPTDSSSRSVLMSRLGEGGWSDVTTVEADADLVWNSVQPSALRAEGEGMLLFVPTSSREGGVLARLSASGSRAIPVRIEMLFYARVAVLREGALVLAYVAYGDPDGNTLYVRRSTLGGDSVGHRIRISEPGAGTVYDPDLHAAGDTLLYLTWGARDTSGVMRQLALATSTDGGRSWQRHASATLAGGFDVLWSGVDARGRLHVVLRGYPGGAPRPVHLLWTGDAWRTTLVPQAPGLTNTGHPVLIFGREGTYRMIWGAAGYEGGKVPAPVSMTSVGREKCPARPSSPPRGSDVTSHASSGVRPARAATLPQGGGDRSPPAGLGTHLSVRGADSPRASSQFEQRGTNASISNDRMEADARRARRRQPRLRGPP